MTKSQPAASATRSKKGAHKPLKPFTVDHWRKYAGLMILDDGDYWRTEGFQDEIVADIFSGVPEIMVVIPEGNGKTSLLGGVNLYYADFTPTANCLVAAASREQAEILFGQASGLVFRSPGFEKRFRVFDGYRKIVATGSKGTIKVKAADDRTGDGAIPDLATIDEPHRARDLSLWRTWRGKLDKRGGQILGISTAGEPGSEFEAARAAMHDAADETVRTGRHTRSASPDSLIHDWRLQPGDDPDDMDLVKQANPLSTITVEKLARKRRSPTMTASHWSRFVCNVATDGETSWIEPEAWDACRGEVELAGHRCFVGVDIGRRKDSSAVVAGAMVDDKLHLWAKVRTPTPERPVAVADARSDVLTFARDLEVAEVVYDPHQFQESAELLEEQGLILVEWPQTDVRMGPASETLYELIQSGRVVHDGDPVLRSHVLAAVPSLTERGVRVSKRKSRKHIDAAVSSVMVAARAVHEPAPAPFVFEVF